jgi:mevalonate kinase
LRSCAVAPAKTILLGEHFVVYGEPAIVTAIDRFVKVTAREINGDALKIISNLGIGGVFDSEGFRPLSGDSDGMRRLEPVKISAKAVLDYLGISRGLEINVDSTIPAAVGLGSSGATAVATVASVGALFGARLSGGEIIELSTEAERFVHGSPSGIDQSVSTYGGVLMYKRGEGIRRISTPAIYLVIGNTGSQRDSGKLIEGVRRLKDTFPELVGKIIRTAGALADFGIHALERGDVETFGKLMDMNHGLLVAIGVSTEALDRLVYAARRGGALGSKLTGAGGGGCIVALCTQEALGKVALAIQEAGGEVIIANKVEEGVRVWLED